MKGKIYNWIFSLGVISTTVFVPTSGADASTTNDPQTDLLRGARLWIVKNRPDMARQLVDKLLALDPYSVEGLGALGDLALREKKPAEAQRILEVLRIKHPQHRITSELETLTRVYGPDGDKLSQMRLMARAGRKAEAAELAKALFPQGPPVLGALALEYHQIMGASPKNGAEASRQLERLYRETGESRYRLAQVEMRMYQGAQATATLMDLETLAEAPDLNAQQLQEIWRKAIDRLDNNGGQHLARVKAFLRRYPSDALMVERLAAMQQATERSERLARDPSNLIRSALRTALDQGKTELVEEQLQALLALKPRDGEALGALGLIKLRQGQHLQAIELFEQAFAANRQGKWQELQDTARFWGLLRQAEAAVEQRELATAAELAQKAISLQQGNAEAWTMLAEIRLLQGQLSESETAYQQALNKEPDNGSALKGLSGLYARSGRSAQALELLDAAALTDQALAGKLSAIRADILQTQASDQAEANRFSAAMRSLEAAVLLQPDNAWTRHQLARLYLRLDLPKEAINVMDEGVDRQSSDPQMRYARALIRTAMDDDPGALHDMQQIPATEQSTSMQALVQRSSVKSLLAQSLLGSSAPSEAIDLLQSAEHIAANDAELLYAVANTWFKRGQPDLGVAVFDRLSSRSPSLSIEGQLEYASLLNRAGNTKKTGEQLTKLLQLSGWTAAQEERLAAIYGDHQERLIEIQRQSGREIEAVRLAREPVPFAEKSTPEHQRSKIQARLLLAAGEYSDAARLLKDLATKLPEDLEIRMNLGDSLSRVNALEEAAQHAEWLKAKIKPSDISRQLTLLRLWQRIGRTEEAVALSEKLLEIAPADSDVLMHAARLEKSHRNYARALVFFQRALAIERPNIALTAQPSVKATLERVASEASDDPPIHLKTSYTLSPVANGIVIAKIYNEIDAIEMRRQAWIEVGQQAMSKRATDGISSVHGWERPSVAWMPRGYDGHYFLHVDQVQLTAGTLPAAYSDALTFAQVAASPPDIYASANKIQKGSGTHIGFGYKGDDTQWDIGVTGMGFPVTNLVGGVARTGTTGQYNYKLELSRRPITGSLLSYAGVRDPISGQVSGGVVATGASARLSTDLGPYSTSVSVSHATITGKNVLSNTKTLARWAVDRDVWTDTHSAVSMGMNLTGWRYAKDLSEYSWGHGGYYSPATYASMSFPVEWSGRIQAVTWLLRGALSLSRSSSNESDYFPADARLQAQARANLAALGRSPLYSGSSGAGFGRSLRGAVEYQISPHLALGAQLTLDRSAYYAPTNLLLYGRYRFDPVLAPLENRPRPVQAYSDF